MYILCLFVCKWVCEYRYVYICASLNDLKLPQWARLAGLRASGSLGEPKEFPGSFREPQRASGNPRSPREPTGSPKEPKGVPGSSGELQRAQRSPREPQGAPGSLLSLPPQYWECKQVPPYCFCLRILGIELRFFHSRHFANRAVFRTSGLTTRLTCGPSLWLHKCEHNTHFHHSAKQPVAFKHFIFVLCV